jgi:LacI family transcriptional regulator
MLYSNERHKGFDAALRARGFSSQALPPVPHDVEYTGKAKRYNAARLWCASLKLPVGIYCADDAVGRSAVTACREAGIDVPTQASIIGTTNDEFACEKSDPALSSVDINAMQIGFKGATLMLRLLDGHKPPCKPIRVPPRGLVVRESSSDVAGLEPTLARVIGHIRAEGGKGLRVTDVTTAFGLSRSVLYRLFRDSLGHSPAKEIMLARMARAKALLVDTDQTLKSIAAAVGFPSVQRMAQAFRRHEQMRPSDYRRQYRLR